MDRGLQEGDLVRKIWGRYLRDEWKYDKFGALGKVLVIQEVLKEEGIHGEFGPDPDLPAYVNEVFPRTFFCLRDREIDTPQSVMIRRYFNALEQRLEESGLTGELLHKTCLEETGEKFCLQVGEVERILLL